MAVIAAALVGLLGGQARAQSLNADAIESAMWRAAEWQIAHPEKFHPVNWEMSPFYDGLLAAARATGEPAYLGEVLGFGTTFGWALGPSMYFADDHAVGHAWLDVYDADKSKENRLAPTKARLDAILKNPQTDPLEIGKPGPQTDRWTWCDALYMGPPTWARMYTATGDDIYLDFLDHEWKYTYDMLWDPDASLFYRDSRFKGQKTANGSKVFWSRGNGWVFGGLAMTIPQLPESRASRAFYIDVFQKMAPAIASAQQPDGLWRPSLLDPEDPDIGEESGSAFFTYGFAWGVNNGYLDRKTYAPVIEKAWKGLLTRQLETGQIGYVQQVGDRPVNTRREDHHTYGTGAFLLAGSEILRGLRPDRVTTLKALMPDGEAYVDAYWDIKRIEGVRVLDSSGDDGNVPANAFDGISQYDGNRWSVEGLGKPKFVEVDLGSPREISGFVVHTYQNRDYQYTIEAGIARDTMIPVVDRTKNSEQGPIRDELAQPIRARYVKVTVTGAATYPGPWVSLREVEIVTPERQERRARPVPKMRALRPAPPREASVFEKNAGWCWYQDERAIIDGHAIVFGSVAGENSPKGRDGWAGDIRVTRVDLDSGDAQRFTLKGGFNCDDHAAPAIYRRSDGRYLAVYSGHSVDRQSRWRVSSEPGSIESWEAERTLDFPERVCYSNLHFLADENGGKGRLYSFLRADGWDPNAMVSDDEGLTWCLAGRLLDWPDRPYVKYASNGRDTIHFITTDGHPRIFDNSVYEGYVMGGKVYDSFGHAVDDFDSAGLTEKTLTKIFQGDPQNVGWTVDMALDPHGYPVVALSVQKDGAAIRNNPNEAIALDHRYMYGRFDGKAWHVHQMAFAGTGFYAAEPDYTGLCAIDPNETSVVYISADVDPETGLPNVSSADNQRHYEIFRGETDDGGESWTWTPITRDSTVDNIRPVIPSSKDYRAVLWMRGSYRTYTDFGTDIVGLVDAR
ncbi:MAG: glycoside hydrolase family 88 protein [Phycisphaeraceae bacterium]|nr:MAG: glycoside hydrolase family 88 protein [Phycisphaeraceae bacterium]